MILPDPPAGWSLRHLISLDPGWQVSVSDEEYVVLATGETIEEAFLAVAERIAGGDYFRWRIYLPPAEPVYDLASRLGLTRQEQAPLTRGRKL